MSKQEEQIQIEKLQEDDRARKLREALEGGEDTCEDPERRFTPRFPASGSKNWIPG